MYNGSFSYGCWRDSCRLQRLPRFCFCTLSSSFSVAVAVMLGGCSIVGNDYEQPDFSLQEIDSWRFPEGAPLSAKAVDPVILAEWWQCFESPSLSSLIERAARANLDIRSARAQLKRARADRRIAGAALSPQLNLGGGGQFDSGPSGSSKLYQASFDASWELDLFGGLQRGVEAAEAEAEAAEAGQQDVLVSVLAEVALNYTDLLATIERKALVLQEVRSQEKYLKIVKAKKSAGAVTTLDVQRSIGNVAAVRAQLPRLDQQIEKVKNRLAVLLGRPPGALHEELAEAGKLLTPKETVAVGIPADMLRRRPDVRQAERKLAAASARVGVAKADLYPRLSLNGSLGVESLSPGGLLSSVLPKAQYVVFDGGRIEGQIEARSAEHEEAVVFYEQTLLAALEEVQNAVAQYSQELLRAPSVKSAVEAARKSKGIAETQFKFGESDFLVVLDAQRTVLDAERQLVEHRAEITSNLIRLYKALGGGWKPESAAKLNALSSYE